MDLTRLHQTTNLADRSRFVWMWSIGMSARSIAQETGASVTTICRWIRRWRKEGHINTRPRRGRPRKNTTSSSLRRYRNSFPSIVGDGREIGQHAAQTFSVTRLQAKITNFLPLNYLSALISFQYLRRMYTDYNQLPITNSGIYAFELCHPLICPDLD